MKCAISIAMNDFSKDKLYFIPLGGCGFFGANLSLYGTHGQWLIVDCGMGFGDDTMPGVDIILPDIHFLEDILDDVIGMVVTHGHEDHIGGIEYLWQRIRKPIYASPFTLGLISEKLSEKGWGKHVPLHPMNDDKALDLGPFQITPIRMCHSVPEMRALKIAADGCGAVLHTGDWKLDPKPVVGDKTDQNALEQLAMENILAVVGDSTNAMVPGHSGSEADVEKNMTELFSEFGGRIAVSCFSSNVARLASISNAARANDRHVCIVGRSLDRIDRVARANGYLENIPEFLNPEDAAYLEPHQIVYVCTGSQGEPRAALSRIANGDHRNVALEKGDVVIFSSRAIPGNEKAINRIKNRLLGRDVTIITDNDAPIHCSGHPYRDEIRLLLDWVKPRYVLPVHGERMQMERHADLAEECGYAAPVVPLNGDVIEISTDKIEKTGRVPEGMLAVEGKRLVPVDHEAILMRRRMMFHGSAVVTVVMTAAGDLIAPPRVTAIGLFDEDNEDDAHYLSGAADAVREALEDMPAREKTSDFPAEETARVAARRYFEAQFSKKPQTRVHLMRV